MQPRPLNSPVLAIFFLSALNTALHLPFLPTLFNLTAPTPHTLKDGHIRNCVSDPSWNPIFHDIAPSCEIALEALIDDSSFWGAQPAHFSYNSGRSFARFPETGKRLPIPKRYVEGRCVVAIVLMRMFEVAGWQVPDLSKGEWPAFDKVSRQDLVEPVGYVRATCMNGCGYAVVGENFGVAVVVWGTNSKWDRFARGMRVGRVGNGTVEGEIFVS